MTHRFIRYIRYILTLFFHESSAGALKSTYSFCALEYNNSYETVADKVAVS